MSSSPELDAKLFSRHILALKKAWNRDSFDAFAFISGVASEENNEGKTLAVHSWLFGYELTDTLIVVTTSQVSILCTVAKAKLLEEMKKGIDAEIKLTIMTLNKKDPEGTTNQFNTLLTALQESHQGKKIGSLISEQKSGPFVEAWTKAFSASGCKSVEASDFVSDLLCVKDAAETKCVRTAATISVSILKNFLVKKIEKVIDTEKPTTHDELSKKVDEFFLHPEKISKQLRPDVVESCYLPVIQSKKYDLSLGAQTNSDKLDFGIIVCSLGAKYKQYCSDIARTYLIEPSKDQEETYNFVLTVQSFLINSMKPGVSLSDLYNNTKTFIAEKKSSLLPNFYSSCGSAIGLELSDPSYTICASNKKKLESGMTFNVRVGFQNIEDPSKGKYAILLGDTVLVTASGSEVLTDKATKKYVDVSYEIDAKNQKSEEDEPVKKEKKDSKPSKKYVITENETQSFSLRRNEKLETVQVGTRSVRKTIARELMTNSSSSEAKRADHQEQLHKEMMKAAKSALQNKKDGKEAKQEAGAKEYISYKSAKDFPADAHMDVIYVDTLRESVLLPIYGQLVPYHISTIKQVTKTEEYLRISFKFPGGPQTQAEKSRNERFAQPSATFIKEMTFRIPNQNSLNTSFRLISELKKRVTSRESEIQTKMTLKVQPALVLSRTGNVPRLQHVTVRPVLGTKRTTGTLEAHTNGFRFVSKKSEHVDIIYDNIKHCFFQPAENSVIVVLHFHLHTDIMIGKKKTQDVQFFAEVMEASEAVSGPSRNQPRWGDVEEIEEEQQQRELRKRLNSEFKNFVKKVEELESANIEFDIPYKELGFYGVPNRNNLFLQPTVHCLINVIEVPFFVLSLDEVQVAYFERVQFSLKNFDLVFVFKDWSAKEVHINSIPVESLETIKDWLDNSNIKYYVGKTNLQWRTLLDRISKNPQKFWDDGGWDVLKEEESDDGEESSGEEGGPDDYSPESEDSSDYSIKESSSDSGSEQYSDESDEGSFEDEEEDEGLSWDDLEEVATKHDAKKAQKRARDDAYDSDDDMRGAKKRKLNNPPPPANKPKMGAIPSKPITTMNKPPVGRQTPAAKPPAKPAVTKPPTKPPTRR